MSYWDNICNIYESQKIKGLYTYGQTLEENKSIDIGRSIEMAQEEMVDMLMYMEKLKDFLENKEHRSESYKNAIEDVIDYVKTDMFLDAWSKAKGERFGDFLEYVLRERFLKENNMDEKITFYGRCKYDSY